MACDILSIDNLREVTVVAEDLFTIAGDRPQVFHWEKYGFKMSVPQGSLEADETCDVAFKAIAHGQFQFPENTQLVSGVYAIAMTQTPSTCHCRGGALRSSQEHRAMQSSQFR